MMSTTTQPLKIPKAKAVAQALPFGLSIGVLAAIGGGAFVVLLVIILAVAGVFGGKAEPTPEPTQVVAEAEPTETIAPTATVEPESVEITVDNARNVEQLQASLAALEVDMTPEWRAEISALSVEPPPATDRLEVQSSSA